MAIRNVDIGFVNECETSKLHPKFFPSKVGGRPAWLDRRNLPQPSSLRCGYCDDQLVFLCQIYAPVDDNDDAFHRTLFLFVCRNPNCCRPNESDNVKVFRCQLKRDNEFYSYEPPDENDEEPFDDTKCPALCAVCGSKGPSHCSKCKKKNYCCKSHQIYDWKNGHKEECCKQEVQQEVTQVFKNKILFPEWELTIEEESEADESKEVSVDEEMKYLQKLIAEKKAGCLADQSENELEQYTDESVEDKTFSKFKKRIGRDPDQVLRYDRGGEPLWITSVNRRAIEDVPPCQYCGGERQFEFQIMPQLLNYLELDVTVHSIDWGILAVYTCSRHCVGKETPYKNEFIVKQDIVATPRVE